VVVVVVWIMVTAMKLVQLQCRESSRAEYEADGLGPMECVAVASQAVASLALKEADFDDPVASEQAWLPNMLPCIKK